MNRKQELADALLPAISEYLSSIRGAHAFGASAKVNRIAGKATEFIIAAGNGEFYLVKVQKSAWRNQPTSDQRTADRVDGYDRDNTGESPDR